MAQGYQDFMRDEDAARRPGFQPVVFTAHDLLLVHSNGVYDDLITPEEQILLRRMLRRHLGLPVDPDLEEVEE